MPPYLDGDLEIIAHPMGNRRIRGGITLDFKRTSTGRSCTYPACNEIANLIGPDKQMRYNIIVQKRIFIPSRAKLCNAHKTIGDWTHLDTSQLEQLDFTAAMVEEMIELLISSAQIRGFHLQTGKATHYLI